VHFTAHRLYEFGCAVLNCSVYSASTSLEKVFALLQVFTALGGAGVAIRHWYLQANRESMIADCGVGFDYMFENFPLQKAFKLLFRGTGDCAAIDWTLLGLTLPQLALICFVSFAAYAIWLLRSSKV